MTGVMGVVAAVVVGGAGLQRCAISLCNKKTYVTCVLCAPHMYYPNARADIVNSHVRSESDGVGLRGITL